MSQIPIFIYLFIFILSESGHLAHGGLAPSVTGTDTATSHSPTHVCPRSAHALTFVIARAIPLHPVGTPLIALNFELL